MLETIAMPFSTVGSVVAAAAIAVANPTSDLGQVISTKPIVQQYSDTIRLQDRSTIEVTKSRQIGQVVVYDLNGYVTTVNEYYEKQR
jgi:hypothetical protein|tara:strand:+ start:431 stop:691 length:261 start_codon:yes stop_codon:yes gene_type:complete